MDKKCTYILIDGYVTNDDSKGNLQELTEKDHDIIMDVIIDAVAEKGYSIGFGSTLLSEKEVEEREDNLAKTDWTTGEYKGWVKRYWRSLMSALKNFAR